MIPKDITEKGNYRGERKQRKAIPKTVYERASRYNDDEYIEEKPKKANVKQTVEEATVVKENVVSKEVKVVEKKIKPTKKEMSAQAKTAKSKIIEEYTQKVDPTISSVVNRRISELVGVTDSLKSVSAKARSLRAEYETEKARVDEDYTAINLVNPNADKLEAMKDEVEISEENVKNIKEDVAKALEAIKKNALKIAETVSGYEQEKQTLKTLENSSPAINFKSREQAIVDRQKAFEKTNPTIDFSAKEQAIVDKQAAFEKTKPVVDFSAKEQAIVDKQTAFEKTKPIVDFSAKEQAIVRKQRMLENKYGAEKVSYQEEISKDIEDLNTEKSANAIDISNWETSKVSFDQEIAEDVSSLNTEKELVAKNWKKERANFKKEIAKDVESLNKEKEENLLDIKNWKKEKTNFKKEIAKDVASLNTEKEAAIKGWEKDKDKQRSVISTFDDAIKNYNAYKVEYNKYATEKLPEIDTLIDQPIVNTVVEPVVTEPVVAGTVANDEPVVAEPVVEPVLNQQEVEPEIVGAEVDEEDAKAKYEKYFGSISGQNNNQQVVEPTAVDPVVEPTADPIVDPVVEPVIQQAPEQKKSIEEILREIMAQIQENYENEKQNKVILPAENIAEFKSLFNDKDNQKSQNRVYETIANKDYNGIGKTIIDKNKDSKAILKEELKYVQLQINDFVKNSQEFDKTLKFDKYYNKLYSDNNDKELLKNDYDFKAISGLANGHKYNVEEYIEAIKAAYEQTQKISEPYPTKVEGDYAYNCINIMDQYIKDKNILTDKQQEEYDTQKAIFARYSDPEAYRKNKMYENAMELQTKIDRLRGGFAAYQEIQMEKKQQYPSIIDKIKAMFAPKQKTIAAAPEVIEPTVAPIEPTAEPVKEETETEKTWVERLEETPAMKTVQEKIVEPLEDAVDKKAKTNKLFALLAGKVNTIDNNKEEENKEEKNRDAYFRYLNEKQAKGEFTQEQVEEAAAKYDRNLEMKNNPNELLNMAEDKEEKLQYESYLGYLDKQIAKGELTKEEAEEYATKFKQEGETKKDITWLERENSTNLFEMLQEGKINQEQYDRLRKQAEYDNVTEKNTKLEYDADDYTEDLLAKFAKIRQDIREEIKSGAITEDEGYSKLEEIGSRFRKKSFEERRKSEEEAQI